MTHQISKSPSRVASMYCRVVFWITAVHLAIFGLLVTASMPQISGLPWFGVRGLGIGQAAVLVLFRWSPIVWCLLIASDVPALLLLSRFIRLRTSPKLLVIYLTAHSDCWGATKRQFARSGGSAHLTHDGLRLWTQHWADKISDVRSYCSAFLRSSSSAG